MAAGAVRETLEEGVEREERSYGDLRRAYQREAGTALARCHPFGNDGSRAIRQRAEERAFSGQGSDVLTVDGQPLAIERVPGIVDGDRA